jgi:hypothetical protein
MKHQAIKANGGAKAYVHAVFNMCRPIYPIEAMLPVHHT